MKLPPLSEKGKYATLIGILIAVPAAIVMSWLLIKNGDYIYLPFIVAFSASIVFFILPSSFVAQFKDFKIEIKD
jgi:hypothetical protein